MPRQGAEQGMKRARVFLLEHVSSRNPFEVFAVIYLVVTGVNWFMGIQPGGQGLQHEVGITWPYFWSGSMALFGFGTLCSYFIPDFVAGKLVKMWCMIGLFGANLAFGLALVLAYGGSRTLGGLFLVLIGVAAAARAGQCFKEVMDLRSRLVLLRDARDAK